MDPRPSHEALSPFLSSLQQSLGKARVIIFGSRARGDARPNSDYALLIISSAFSGVRFYERQVRICQLLPRNIDADLICLTPDEFSARSMSLSIIGGAAREGVELTA